MPTDVSLSQLHEPAVAATVAGPAVSERGRRGVIAGYPDHSG